MADDPISALADEVRRLRQDVAGMRAELAEHTLALRRLEKEAARRHGWLVDALFEDPGIADISDDVNDLLSRR